MIVLLCLEVKWAVSNLKARVFTLYVCFVCVRVCVVVCVYLCVYLSVAILQASLFNIGGWNFNVVTYVDISIWYLLLFSIFNFFFSYYPFSFVTIFFILRLQVNLSGKEIHQIEAIVTVWNILCIMILIA